MSKIWTGLSVVVALVAGITQANAGASCSGGGYSFGAQRSYAPRVAIARVAPRMVAPAPVRQMASRPPVAKAAVETDIVVRRAPAKVAVAAVRTEPRATSVTPAKSVTSATTSVTSAPAVAAPAAVDVDVRVEEVSVSAVAARLAAMNSIVNTATAQ